MRRKRAIKRMLLTIMWLGVAAGMGTIIMAAMKEQELGVCKGYKIKIKGFREDMLFTSKDQIVDLLKAAAKGDITGQRKSDFDLPVMEDLLEQSSWVYNADLYFDNGNILHAHVTERQPLARVFTNKGTSFYIDEASKQIPLSGKISLDLPVFTGYPSKKVLNAADSLLIQNVIATASFINSDPFWNAQVAQIDISRCGLDCWSMEMIPTVGNHKVELGDGSDIASKFHRLYLFYNQVLKRTGFDKYQKIDAQYYGQVIGTKGKYTRVDSLQLRKNIENLLQDSRTSNEMLQVAPTVGYTAIVPQDSMYNKAVRSDSVVLQDSVARDKPVEKKPLSATVSKPDTDSGRKEKKASGLKQKKKTTEKTARKEDQTKSKSSKKINN